ncbi:MAG: hypothetical protein NTY77_16555 [Elusimicrobia bacterium]|nr:hypothetical protein [Elusimicrobiota bacterium]
MSLLLVELVPDEADRHFRASSYPFLMGLARPLGWRASWIALGVRYDPTLSYALEPGDLKLLRAELRRRKPDIVVLNERLRDGQWTELGAGGARLVYCPLDEDLSALGRFVKEHLGAEGPGLDDPYLADRVRPGFARRVINAAPWAAAPPIRVVAGLRCSYRKRLAGLPLYRGLSLPLRHMGCSFCFAGCLPEQPFARDPVAFAAREAAAACRARLPAGLERRFVFVGHELWRRLEKLACALSRQGVRAAELGFMPRIDEFLAARAALERCLPRLAARGLSLRLYGMGVENFSPAENRRLNKGISAAQVHEAVRLIAELSRRWPRHFRYPSRHLSTILFTPWTTPADLRVNLRAIGRCPLIHHGSALGSRLQLFPGRPITALAEADGLVLRRHDDRSYNSGCVVAADQEELPWRFAHPQTAVLWRLARRLSTNRRGLAEDDEEARAVAALLPPQEGCPEPPDPLPLFARAVALMAGRPRIRSLDRLLQGLGRKS